MLVARPHFLRWTDPSRPLIGMNCFSPFGLGVKTGFNTGDYLTDPYVIGGADTSVFSNAVMDSILEAGFDFVRMVIDPATLYAVGDSGAVNGTTRIDALIALILTGVNRRTARGLKVIVDMHQPVAWTTGWLDSNMIDGVGNAKFEQMVRTHARLAGALANTRPDLVAIELFNEPPPLASFSGKPAWNAQLKYHFDKVRAAANRHTIIVSGMDYAAIDGNTAGTADANSGITNITVANYDANTGFGIHPYEHFIFSLQGVGFYGAAQNLTWPASAHPGGQAAAEAAFTSNGGNVAAFITDTGASYSFERYFDEANEAFIEARLQKAVNHVVAGGLTSKHVMNTEFGVNFNGANLAPLASAVAYIEAQADKARSLNIGCVCIHQKEFTTGYDIMPAGVFVPEIIAALFS